MFLIPRKRQTSLKMMALHMHMLNMDKDDFSANATYVNAFFRKVRIITLVSGLSESGRSGVVFYQNLLHPFVCPEFSRTIVPATARN